MQDSNYKMFLKGQSGCNVLTCNYSPTVNQQQDARERIIINGRLENLPGNPRTPL